MEEKNKKDIPFELKKAGYQPKKDQIIQEGYKPKPTSDTQDSSQCEPPKGGSGAEEPNKQDITE